MTGSSGLIVLDDGPLQRRFLFLVIVCSLCTLSTKTWADFSFQISAEMLSFQGAVQDAASFQASPTRESFPASTEVSTRLD